MKRMFFTLIIVASMPLIALPNEASLPICDGISKQIHNSCRSECEECLPAPRASKGPKEEIEPMGRIGSDTIVDRRVYGSFFTTDNVVVTNGNPVLFTDASDANRGVSLDAEGGVVLLSQPGDYLVIFGVSSSTEPMAPSSYALTLDDVVFVDGSNVGSVNDNQMTTISTTVRVPKKPSQARLSVINFGIPSSSPFTLSSATTGDLTAFIIVKKLNSLAKSTP